MMWEVVETKKGYIPKPKEVLQCPVCGAPLILHDFNPAYHSLKNFHHVDVHMKCPKCSLWLTFGVPVSKEDYEKLKNSPLRMKVLTNELLNIDVLTEKEEEIIKKRLEALGYW